MHLIPVSSEASNLFRAIGETQHRYCGYSNARLPVTGHLFQGHFGSVAMNEAHLMAAFRYVAMHPVKAKLVCQPVDSPWSSTPAHLAGHDDARINVLPLPARLDDVAQFLSREADRHRSKDCSPARASADH